MGDFTSYVGTRWCVYACALLALSQGRKWCAHAQRQGVVKIVSLNYVVDVLMYLLSGIGHRNACWKQP